MEQMDKYSNFLGNTQRDTCQLSKKEFITSSLYSKPGTHKASK